MYQNETKNLENAVDSALDEMPKEFTIRNFLVENREKVKEMIVAEFEEERMMNSLLEEGRKAGRIATLASMIKKGRLTEEEAAKEEGTTVSEFKRDVQTYCS